MGNQNKEELYMEFEVNKISDKIKGLDVKGQGCKNDCKQGYWSGNNNYYAAGCKWVVKKPTAQTTTMW